MAKSRRIINLENRIRFLENKILPKTRVLGGYSKTEQYKIKSHVLLVHAEIERYLEDIVREKVEKSFEMFSNTGRLSLPITSILAFHGGSISYDGKPRADSKSLYFRLNTTISHFYQLIRANHGIKDDNILQLLIPIGVKYEDLDELWMIDMSRFGSMRGDFAHNTNYVAQEVDKKTVVDFINNNILPGLVRVDQLIREI